MSRPRKKKIPFSLDPNRKAFERQPGESDKAWQAFVLYRDMGFQRSAKVVAGQYKEATRSKATLDSTYATLMKWSAEYLWVSRCFEWDNYLDAKRRRAKVFEIEEMKRRHLKLATSLQGLGAIELQKWLTKVQTSKDSDTVELTTGDIRALIDLGIRIERLNRDEPESVNKIEKEVSVEDKRAALQKQLEDPNIWEELMKLEKIIEA
jgi:hypothetical protein